MLQTTPALPIRQEDWAHSLARMVDAWRDRSFVWGEADCLLFCRACSEAITGADILADLPAYASELGAARELRRLGFANPADLLVSRLEETRPAMARRGDWVMLEGGGLVPGSFGVNVGRHSVHMGETGLVWVPAASAVRAWVIA